jgi:hypothetical protein
VVNYLFVFCINKVSLCIFDKQTRKLKGINGAKLALFNDRAKVWCSSNFLRYLLFATAIVDPAGPQQALASGTTKF